MNGPKLVMSLYFNGSTLSRTYIEYNPINLMYLGGGLCEFLCIVGIDRLNICLICLSERTHGRLMEHALLNDESEKDMISFVL